MKRQDVIWKMSLNVKIRTGPQFVKYWKNWCQNYSQIEIAEITKA